MEERPLTMDWQPIETAPKDGTPITAKRVYEGRLVWEGECSWQEHINEPLWDELRGEWFGGHSKSMRWKYLDKPYCVPTPTHWKQH